MPGPAKPGPEEPGRLVMELQELDVNTLLAAAREGDQEAVAELLRRESAPLRAHVEGEIGTRWRPYLTADDVLQETFLDAFRSIHRFVPDGQNSLIRWLKRIASSKIVDAIRAISREQADGRRSPRLVLGLDPYVALLTSLTGGAVPSATRGLVRAEATALLRRALEHLPDEHRAIVERFDLAGTPMQAIAADLGKTVGASYLARKRALDMLRDSLARESTVFRAFS